jgi:hypothetical protein
MSRVTGFEQGETGNDNFPRSEHYGPLYRIFTYLSLNIHRIHRQIHQVYEFETTTFKFGHSKDENTHRHRIQRQQQIHSFIFIGLKNFSALERFQEQAFT